MNCTSSLRDPRCDGNGDFCVHLNICICDSGWTALGSFSSKEGFKCDIHKDTIKGLNIIETFVVSVYLLLIVQHIIGKKNYSMEYLRTFLTDPKIFCTLLFLLIGISDIVISITKLLYEEEKILGKDILVSTASTFFLFFCFAGLSIYFQIVLNVLKGSPRLQASRKSIEILNRLATMRNFSWSIVLLSIPISLSAILSAVSPKNSKTFAMIFIIGTGSLIFLYGILYIATLGFIVERLKNHIEELSDIEMTGDKSVLQLVLKRLSVAYYVGSGSLLGGSALLILFGSWDFLFRKFAYLSIFARINSIILFTVLFVTISGIPNARKTPRAISTILMRRNTPTHPIDYEEGKLWNLHLLQDNSF